MGHFGGLLGCGARRWGREDVVVLTGGAVVLGACALFLWWVLVVVVGGAGVLLERSVCLGSGTLQTTFNDASVLSVLLLKGDSTSSVHTNVRCGLADSNNARPSRHTAPWRCRAPAAVPCPAPLWIVAVSTCSIFNAEYCGRTTAETTAIHSIQSYVASTRSAHCSATHIRCVLTPMTFTLRYVAPPHPNNPHRLLSPFLLTPFRLTPCDHTPPSSHRHSIRPLFP